MKYRGIELDMVTVLVTLERKRGKLLSQQQLWFLQEYLDKGPEKYRRMPATLRSTPAHSQITVMMGEYLLSLRPISHKLTVVG